MILRSILFVVLSLLFVGSNNYSPTRGWIRINLLGYQPQSIKVAVWCGKSPVTQKQFELINVATNKTEFRSKIGRDFGNYGPFTNTHRLNFTSFTTSGRYVIKVGDVTSPVFQIDNTVYHGTADFALHYMRQQRSKYNPFLRDSCHTKDGYTMDGSMKDSTLIDVSGGWHDATDYLQYSMTSANATYHLLAAYRDFPTVFSDQHRDNGLEGSNGVADVLDEARWGLDWLLKMHPKADWMFNQLADDRDHRGFRLPNKDTASYGYDLRRPVYFVTGKVQGLGKYKNRTKGTSSIAGKFSSAFSLGNLLYKDADGDYASLLRERATSAYQFGMRIRGNTQTSCYVSPYFYEEDNWVDDMELAAAQLYAVTNTDTLQRAAMNYARMEKTTPWLGSDTASHYQWYPFINLGHYELAKLSEGPARKEVESFYKQGIELVNARARQNAFLRGVPYIWCSNNLQAAFAIQCYWYRVLTGDTQFAELEQATMDYLFGCNPWGTSMAVGLPLNRDYPDDPHSSLNVLHQYQTWGALVDGPVYGTIYRKQLGVSVVRGDEYKEFQSSYVVYHDDYGDYVTNEPTMDGTASLVYLLAAMDHRAGDARVFDRGAVVRGDRRKRQVALVFTGDTFNDGGEIIARTLRQQKVKASFFLTGSFYANTSHSKVVKSLKADGHYLGPHSNRHLLYNSWTHRDSLLVTRKQFVDDLNANYAAMSAYGIRRDQARYFLPPFEWYSDSIARWTAEQGLQLVNYTPGTLSHGDYTTPDMSRYRSSDVIIESIRSKADDMNGFMLLMHIGTDPARKDKLYQRLPEVIGILKAKGYELVTVDALLNTQSQEPK